MKTKFITRITWTLILVLLILLLSSCSVQKRAQRHIKRARQLDPSAFVLKTVTDTVTIKTDSIVTEFVQVHDTTIIQRDNLGQEIKIEYRWREYTNAPDTIEIEVDCPDQQTINTVTTETVFVKPTIWQKAKSLWWAFLALIIFILIQKIRK